MKKTIWKFEIKATDKQHIKMPKGAEILYIDNQYEVANLWALVDPKEEMEERTFEVFGTGHEIYYDMGVDRNHIGSFQLNQGTLVFHVFERM